MNVVHGLVVFFIIILILGAIYWGITKVTLPEPVKVALYVLIVVGALVYLLNHLSLFGI